MPNSGGEPDSFDLLQRVLAEDGGETDLLDDQRTLRGVFEGLHGRFWTYARIPRELDLLLCYSRCPFDSPPELVPLAAELVARLNFGLRVGNLEIEMDTGEIRFKSSLDFRNVPLSEALIMNVFLPCAYALDRFLPALEALIIEGASVEGALARLDGA